MLCVLKSLWHDWRRTHRVALNHRPLQREAEINLRVFVDDHLVLSDVLIRSANGETTLFSRRHWCRRLVVLLSGANAFRLFTPKMDAPKALSGEYSDRRSSGGN